MKRLSRLFWALTIAQLLFLACSCSAAWTTEAINIIQLLGPAITAALGIITAFGKGVSAQTLQAVTSWSNQATTALQEAATLINQYEAAPASAKTGILSQIQTIISTVSSGLTTILPELHITDPDTQAKVTAVVEAVQSELAALVALVPALQSAAKLNSPHAQIAEITSNEAFHKLKDAKAFRKDFNSKSGTFGKQYEI